MVAQIADAIRPTQMEIEDLATRETQCAELDRFKPICAGPTAALALIAFVVLATVPAGLWRIFRAAFRTDGN